MKNNNLKEPRVSIAGVKVWCAYDCIEDVENLKPHPKNPNQHTDSQIRILAKIIRDKGWREPVTVSNLSGFIIKGHGRLQAAVEMGAKKVPVVLQNYPDKSAEYQDLVADNQIAEMSWIDDDVLDEIMAELNDFEKNLDIEFLGYDYEKFNEIEKKKEKKKEKESWVPDKDPNILVRLSIHPGVWLGKRDEIIGVLNKLEKTYSCVTRIEE